MKLKLLPKMILSLVVLGTVLTVSLSYFGYYNTETYLEEMYAYRVVFGAKSIAAMLDVEDVKTIISEGGDKTEAYRRTRALLEKLKLEGGITYLSLVTRTSVSATYYIDCNIPEMGDNPADEMPYGTVSVYTESAKTEEEMQRYRLAWDCYVNGRAIDPPTVTNNKFGYNYNSAAPILDENGETIAEIQYVLDMRDVQAYLNSSLYSMLGIAALVVGAAVILYILFVRKTVTKPIGKLAEFTKGVTAAGQFNTQHIDLKTGDEIEELGKAFNFMLVELDHYIHDLTAMTAEKERIGAELDVATHIQSSMLPCIFPAFPERSEFDIYATMNPAKEVGGDFYDFFMVDERHLAIVMADVSGKGVPAALFMVIGKTLIKDHTQPGVDLGSVFSEVNDLLCESNSEGLFITAFEGVLDLLTGEFTFVNAGHELPFIAKSGEPFAPYKIRAGFVLAGMEEMRYRCGSIELAPGDKIFQYTDGVTEATDRDDQLYGMERLEQVLAKNTDKSPHDLLPLVKADIDAFVGDAPQFDDITMLCMEFKHRMKEE